MFDDVEYDFLKIDALLKGESVLDDKFDIERVMVAISGYNKKLDFLKELKKRRIEAIDQQVDTIEKNISVLQNAIANCMHQNNEKTLDFPGIGKVSVRKTKGTWQVIDDEKLLKFLENHKLDDKVVESSWKFKKKDLNKILDQLMENNNIPDSVYKEDDRNSLTMSFAKPDMKDASQTINVQSNPSVSQDFDKLVI